jgi:RES domain-containing protein
MPVVFRLAKKRHPVYDPAGAVKVGGRWSSPGLPVIYAAEHYATAILEILVHYFRVALPEPHHARPIFIPDDLRVERFDPATYPTWHEEGSEEARAYGNTWFAEQRTAVLMVPSVVGQPAEWNVLINTVHPEANRIQPLREFDVTWDGRLFGPPPDRVTLEPPSRRS